MHFSWFFFLLYFSYSGPVSVPEIYQTFSHLGTFALAYLYLEHLKKKNLDICLADLVSFFRSYFPPQIHFPWLIFVKLAPAFTIYFVLFIVICIELAYSFISSLFDTSTRKKSQWKDKICGHIICFPTKFISYNGEYLLNKWKTWARKYQGRKTFLNFKESDLGQMVEKIESLSSGKF